MLILVKLNFNLNETYKSYNKITIKIGCNSLETQFPLLNKNVINANVKIKTKEYKLNFEIFIIMEHNN